MTIVIYKNILKHKVTGEFATQINIMDADNYDDYEWKDDEEYLKIIGELENGRK